ncbi:MAG: HupE/UreJ family protein [Betaproteobacteria bacterium]|nr:HupE/UreJ family protein [Betaproteobacteria bacterium]
MTKGARLLLGFPALLASGAAMAHVGVHSAGGFTAGFAHPFVGLDHLLAMVAVGLWAVQLGGRHLLALPAAFVLAMVAGALLGAAGIAMPLVEIAIALSVVVMGLLLAMSPPAAWRWAIPLIAAFGVVHGHAHGAEMPAFAEPWQYFAGFAAATAALHALGVGGGVLLQRHATLLRTGGTAIGLAGLWLVATIS